jgi:NAD-dependent protein deacetylase sirtuin 5
VALMIILKVHPAAGFAKTVKGRGGKVAVFNVENPNEDDGVDFLFLGTCEETIPKLFDI